MAMTEADEPSDDELLRLIGTLGAAANVASNADLDQPLRDLGEHVAGTVADQLRDLTKNEPPEDHC